jgi:hypothetical protein
MKKNNSTINILRWQISNGSPNITNSSGNIHSIPQLYKHYITDYYRYVDDLLIILVYNKDTTNTENTLAAFNSTHLNIQFTIEKETHNKLNYLDFTIINLHNTLTLNIYRKPTSLI